MPTALEIFRMLIDDPYYQAENGQTREEVVWSEAHQRERQHRNNQAALSLAWDGSSSVKSLWNFLNKAEDDENEGDGPKQIDPARVTRMVQVTPLYSLRKRFAEHRRATAKENQYLITSGLGAVGSIRNTASHDIEALKALFEEKSIGRTLTSDKRAERKDIALNLGGKKEESASGNYDHAVLAHMLARYNDLEEDERALNEFGSGRPAFRIGHTEFTDTHSDLIRNNLLSGINLYPRESIRTTLDTISNERKRVGAAIEQYLPTRGQLPDFEAQKAILSGLGTNLWQAGQYHEREEEVTPRQTAIKWSDFDLSDPEDVAYLIKIGQFTELEYENMIADEGNNRGAMQFYKEKYSNVFPEFNDFDASRVVRGKMDDETTLKMRAELLQLTLYNPNKRLGADNLRELLKAAEKRAGKEESLAGSFRIDPEVNRLLSSLHVTEQQAVLEELLESNMFFQLMNPDDEGNSNLLGVLKEIINIQRESDYDLTRLKGVVRSISLDSIKSREHTRVKPSFWRTIKPDDDHMKGPLPDTMADVGHRIAMTPQQHEDAKATLASDDFGDAVSYLDHNPVNMLGHSIPGMYLDMKAANKVGEAHIGQISGKSEPGGELTAIEKVRKARKELDDSLAAAENNPQYVQNKQGFDAKWAEPLKERERYQVWLNDNISSTMEDIKQRGLETNPQGVLLSPREALHILQEPIRESYRALTGIPDVLSIAGENEQQQDYAKLEREALEAVKKDEQLQMELLGHPLAYFTAERQQERGLIGGGEQTDEEKLNLRKWRDALKQGYMGQQQVGRETIYHNLHTPPVAPPEYGLELPDIVRKYLPKVDQLERDIQFDSSEDAIAFRTEWDKYKAAIAEYGPEWAEHLSSQSMKALQSKYSYEQEGQALGDELEAIKAESYRIHTPNLRTAEQAYIARITQMHNDVLKTVRPQFFAKRKQFLSDVIDEMAASGVSATKALENMNQSGYGELSQVLIPAELDWLNSISQPLIKSMYIGGDMASALHDIGGESLPNDMNPNPTMIIGFEVADQQQDQKSQEELVASLLENNVPYQQMVSALKNMGINVQIGIGRQNTLQGDNFIDIHSDEQINRELQSYKSSFVVNPDLQMFPDEIANLLSGGEVSHTKDKSGKMESRSRDSYYERLTAPDSVDANGNVVSAGWNSISQQGKNFLYAIPGVGVPTFEQPQKDADGNPVYTDETTTKSTPTFNLWMPDPDTGVSGWVYNKHKKTGANLTTKTRFIISMPDRVTEKGLEAIETLKAVLGLPDDYDVNELEYRGEDDKRDTYIQRPETGKMRRIEVLDTVPVIENVPMNTYPKNPTTKQRSGFLTWVNNLRELMSRTVHPTQGHLTQGADGKWAYGGSPVNITMTDESTGIKHTTSLGNVLRYLSLRDLNSALGHLNARTVAEISGSSPTPRVYNRIPEHEEQDDEGKIILVSDGIEAGYIEHYRLNTGEYIKIPEKQDITGKWVKDEDSLEIKDPETGKWLVEMLKGGRETRFGLGEEHTTERGRVEAHNIKVIQEYGNTEANIYAKDVQKAKERVNKEEMIRAELNRTEVQDTMFDRAGVIDPLVDIMIQWHELDDAPRFEVPEDLREVINEAFPIFKSLNPVVQHNLDSFLTNFYRQFARRYDYNMAKADQATLDNDERAEANLKNSVKIYTNDLQKKIDNGETWQFSTKRETPLAERGEENLAERALARSRYGDAFAEGQAESSPAELREAEGLPSSGVYTEDEVLVGVGSDSRLVSQSEAIALRTKMLEDSLYSSNRAEIIRDLPFMTDKMLKGDDYSYIDKDGNITVSDIDDPRGNVGAGTLVNPTLQGGIASIPTLPLRFVYPIERFTKRAMSDIGLGRMVPTPYLWIMEHEEVFRELAQHENISMGEIVESLSDPDTGEITQASIKVWLGERGFMTEGNQVIAAGAGGRFYGSTLPDRMVQTAETIELRESQNIPEGEVSSAARQGKFLHERMEAQTKADALATLERQAEVRAGSPDPYPHYADLNAPLSGFSEDSSIQDVLVKLWGDPNKEEGEQKKEEEAGREAAGIRLIEGDPPSQAIDFRQLYTENGAPWTPPKAVGKDGKYFWNLFPIEADGGGSLLFSELHSILREILSYIERVDFDPQYAPGLRSAEGQYSSFILIDPRTGEAREIPQSDNPEENITIEYKDWLGIMEEAGIGEALSEEAKKTGNLYDVIADLIFLHDNMLDLANAQGRERIPMPHLTQQRNIGGVHIFADSFSDSLEALALQPIGIERWDRDGEPAYGEIDGIPNLHKTDILNVLNWGGEDEQYFKERPGHRAYRAKEPLRPPTTMQEVAQQRSMIYRFLSLHDTDPVLQDAKFKSLLEQDPDRHRDILTYYQDLGKIMKTFIIPDIDSHKALKLESAVRDWAEKERDTLGGMNVINQDGTLRLFNDDGSVNSELVDFLLPYWFTLMSFPATGKTVSTKHYRDGYFSDRTDEVQNIPPTGIDTPFKLGRGERDWDWIETLATYGRHNNLPEANLWNWDEGAPAYDYIRTLMKDHITQDALGNERLVLGTVGRGGVTNPGDEGLRSYLWDNWDRLFGVGDKSILKKENLRVGRIDKAQREAGLYSLLDIQSILGKMTQHVETADPIEPTEQPPVTPEQPSTIEGDEPVRDAAISALTPAELERNQNLAILDGIMKRLAAANTLQDVNRFTEDLQNGLMDIDEPLPAAKFLEIARARAANKDTDGNPLAPLPENIWERFPGYMEFRDTLESPDDLQMFTGTDLVFPQAQLGLEQPEIPDPAADLSADDSLEWANLKSDYENAVKSFNGYVAKNKKNKLDKQKPSYEPAGFNERRRAVEEMANRLNAFLYSEGSDGAIFNDDQMAALIDPENPWHLPGIDGVEAVARRAGKFGVAAFVPPWLREAGVNEGDPNHWRNDIGEIGRGRTGIPWEQKLDWLSKTRWKPTYQPKEMKIIKDLYYGESPQDERNPWYIVHQPTDEQIAEANLTRMFAEDSTGWPHGMDKVLSDNYFKIHPDFMERFENNQAPAEYIRSLLQLDLTQPVVAQWWDGLAPDEQQYLLEWTLSVDNFEDEDAGILKDYQDHRSIIWGGYFTNLVLNQFRLPADITAFPLLISESSYDATTLSLHIAELLGKDGEDIIDRPMPSFGTVNRQGELVGMGTFDHPTASDADTTPLSLSTYGQGLTSRYFDLLWYLSRNPETIDQIREHLGEAEWLPPEKGSTDTAAWVQFRALLGNSEEVGGLGLLDNLMSGFREPEENEAGGWVNTGPERTWEEQLQATEHYIMALQRAYNKVRDDPQWRDSNGNMRNDLQLEWNEAIGGYVDIGHVTRASGNVLTEGAYKELDALGLIPEGMEFKPRGGQREIPIEAFRTDDNPDGTLNPEWFWKNDPEALARLWTADTSPTDDEIISYQSHDKLGIVKTFHKSLIGQWVNTLHTENPERFLDTEGVLNPTANKYINPDAPPITKPKPGDDKKGADGGAGGGEGIITPPPDRRTAQIDQIINAWKKGDKPLSDEAIEAIHTMPDSDLNAYHKDVVVTPLLEQHALGVTGKDVLYDGKYADQKIKEIQAAYKILNGAEVDPARLESMNMSALNKEHANVHQQVQEYQQKTFVKRANDISAIQPLSEESKQSPHDVLQQYRRIMYHAKLYSEHMDEDKNLQLRELFKDVAEGQSLFDLNALEADIDKFREQQVEAVQNGQSPLLYGSLEHLEQEQQKYEQGQQTRQAYIDYLTDPNSGALASDMRHANNEANVWRQRGEYVENPYGGEPLAPADSPLNSYAPLQSGARLTYHRGRRKGELRDEGGARDDIREDAPDVFVRGGAYDANIDPDRANAGPRLTHSNNAPKIFGLPEDLEEAYNFAHRSSIDIKQLTRELGMQFSEEASIQDKIDTLNEYVEIGAYNPLDYEIDPERINQAAIAYGTSMGILNTAVTEGEISENTLATMTGAMGYDGETAHEEMMARGHNAEGMPIDAETGIEQPAPLYYSQSRKTLVPRVYHAGTRMWYDPEMLDAIQNSEGWGRWVNNPYDLVNEAGVRIGTNEDGSPKFLDEEDADRYRFGIPAVNSWDQMFDNAGVAIPDAHHGVMVTRIGVFPVGDGTDVKDDPDNEYYGFPGMDENGNLNHDPQSIQEISSAVWALARTNDQLTDPNRFMGPNNTELNSVTITPEGQFAGGWKEWLENPTLGLLDMPGVRDLPGMRGIDRAMNGLPSQRMGATDPNLKISWWTGPQSYTGRATVAGPASTAMGSPAMGTGREGLSRVEALRQHIAGQGDYNEEPKGPTTQEKLQNTANDLNTQTTGQSTVSPMFLRRVHAHIAGTAKDWQEYSDQFMATGKAMKYPEEVLQAHLDAQETIMQEALARKEGMPSPTVKKPKSETSVPSAPGPTAGQIPIPSSLEPVQPQQVQPVEQEPEPEALENPVQ